MDNTLAKSGARKRYPTLDLLRLVAIGMVILRHTPSVTERVPFIRPFSNGLWLGVDLFMLISGWLLGGQLLREARRGEVSRWRFYVKRWMRTLPPYYFMLVVLYFARWGQFAGPLPARDIFAHVFFLQGYVAPNLYGISWSLCVEEHFYLMLPLLVAVLARWRRASVALALVAATEAISVGLRLWIYAHASTQLDVPSLSVVRSDGLFLGVLLAWINVERPAMWASLGRFCRLALPIGVAGTALVMARMPAPPSVVLFVVIPTLGTWTLAAAFFACVHERSWASRIDFRGLEYLGGLTYALYLTHDVVPRAWLPDRLAATPVGSVGKLAGAFVMALLLHHLVERPALNLRARLMASWRERSLSERPVIVAAAEAP